jgi:hypothetical protein
MASNMNLEDSDPILTEEEGNEVVFEMDLYAGGPSALGASATNQGYVLQFPLRTVRHPYHDPTRVKLKPKVKRMQWDIPLNRSKNYNDDVDQLIKLRSFSLQSSRVDPGMQGLAIGIRKDNDVFLVPVSEVLQLRHSPAYLDKEREGIIATGAGTVGRGGRSGGSSAGAATTFAENGGASGSGLVTIKQEDNELLPITVQVKKHETEQQTEARLRSYAFHAQQEEADSFIDLKFVGTDTEQSAAILDRIPEVVRKGDDVIATHLRKSYLEVIAPGSACILENIHLGDDTTNIDGAGGTTAGAGELGRPVGQLGGGSGGEGVTGTQLSADALAALPSQLAAFFGVDRVLSLESIRTMLAKLPSHAVLNRTGERASDSALHKAIMDSGNFVCIRKSYTPRLVNNPEIDAFRTIIIELLQEREQFKRAEIVDVAKQRGVTMPSDAHYLKVIKMVCASKGSNWVMKAGSGTEV